MLAEDKDNDTIRKSEENLRRAKEDLQEKTARIAKKGKSNEIFRKTMTSGLSILRRPILLILIIVAIAVVAILLYTQVHLTDQSYKIENYNALWNQSLTDLRSGNSTLDQYCNNRVHDVDFCNRYWNLQYFN